jgi:hypothetical protein
MNKRGPTICIFSRTALVLPNEICRASFSFYFYSRNDFSRYGEISLLVYFDLFYAGYPCKKQMAYYKLSNPGNPNPSTPLYKDA